LKNAMNLKYGEGEEWKTHAKGKTELGRDSTESLSEWTSEMWEKITGNDESEQQPEESNDKQVTEQMASAERGLSFLPRFTALLDLMSPTEDLSEVDALYAMAVENVDLFIGHHEQAYRAYVAEQIIQGEIKKQEMLDQDLVQPAADAG